jgi:hypothetical protein
VSVRLGAPHAARGESCFALSRGVDEMKSVIRFALQEYFKMDKSNPSLGEKRKKHILRCTTDERCRPSLTLDSIIRGVTNRATRFY